MITVPITESCSMLAVDSKTLRQWLKHSNLLLHPHPTDARMKCLTIEQVQQLAALHGRSIKRDAAPPLEPVSAPASLVQPQKTAEEQPERLVAPAQLGNSFAVPDASDLAKLLSSLETTVISLQQQVAELALELVHERELRYERRLSTLETLVQQIVGLSPSPQDAEVSVVGGLPNVPSPTEWCPYPAELRARSRVLPLVEYGAHETYVIISPQEGELFFNPDSPEWFDWLASLSSFRFVGQLGRFTANREIRHGEPTRRWSANLSKQNRKYDYYLGTTDRLTISGLEQAAVTLQSRTKLS
jgi:hypothetical protein